MRADKLKGNNPVVSESDSDYSFL